MFDSLNITIRKGDKMMLNFKKIWCRGLMLAAVVLGVAIGVIGAPVALAEEGTTLSLSATVYRTLPQDRLQVNLNFDKQGKTAEEVQKAINGKMQEAQRAYSLVKNIKPTTGGYNVWREYAPEPAPRPDGTPAWTPAQREKAATWRGNQVLMLEGAAQDADFIKLIGTLQGMGFATQGMNYMLSRAATEEARDELIVEALGSLRQRANRMAKALEMRKVEFVNISTDGQPIMPVPMPMYERMKTGAVMAMAGDAMPAPVGQAGESEVNVTVTAQVRLSN